jgi:hypothetical protein
MPLFMLYSIRGLICNPYFCRDGVATLLQYQRERYDLYGRPLVGGFSPHFVGDSQWGWLHYTAIVRGGPFLGLGGPLRLHVDA